MNLTSYEFILCQEEKKSPLILSEFCGSARSLSGGEFISLALFFAYTTLISTSTAIHVNPWFLEGVANGIKSALTMDEEEKVLKHQTLFEFVKSHDSKRWG